MTLRQAIELVRKASTKKGQLSMSREDWEEVPYARKLLAEEYVRHVAG